MKKRNSLIIIIILVILICLFCYIKSKPYEYEIIYNINKYRIIEIYSIDEEIYKFYIEVGDNVFAYGLQNEYIKSKELIDDITYYENDYEVCILPISNYLDFYPLCSSNNEVYSYNLSEIAIDDFNYEPIDILDKEYASIKINYLDRSNYLLFNYRGFIYINKEYYNTIDLFSKDVYSMPLVYQIDNYVIIPDYESDYYFNKIYVINLDTGKYKEIEFDFDISFDSYFLGDYKNNVYLLDRKEEKEYKINIKKLKIEEADFVILKNGVLENTTYKKIINNNLLFDNAKKYNYEVIDGILYEVVGDYKVKISNKEETSVINVINDTVYYISDDSLYLYNNTYGEVLLFIYSEWNFNNNNMIFIY